MLIFWMQYIFSNSVWRKANNLSWCDWYLFAFTEYLVRCLFPYYLPLSDDVLFYIRCPFFSLGALSRNEYQTSATWHPFTPHSLSSFDLFTGCYWWSDFGVRMFRVNASIPKQFARGMSDTFCTMELTNWSCAYSLDWWFRRSRVYCGKIFPGTLFHISFFQN